MDLKKFNIPNISDEKVYKLFKKIKPLWKLDKILYYVEDEDPIKKALNFNFIKKEVAKNLIKVDEQLFLSSSHPALWKYR